MSQLNAKYHLDYFVFDHIYPVNGSIAVEFHGKNNTNLLKSAQKESNESSQEKLLKGIVILKTQANNLSFGKVINLQVDPR